MCLVAFVISCPIANLLAEVVVGHYKFIRFILKVLWFLHIVGEFHRPTLQRNHSAFKMKLVNLFFCAVFLCCVCVYFLTFNPSNVIIDGKCSPETVVMSFPFLRNLQF